MDSVLLEEIVKAAFTVFFIGLCLGLFFGILSRVISLAAGIIKKFIS